MTKTIVQISLAAIISGIFLSSIVIATPYITPEQWENIQSSPSQRIFLPAVDYTIIRAKFQTLTDEGCAYIAEYIQICDFLIAWQVPDTSSPNYGGMIEGESGGAALFPICVWITGRESTGTLLDTDKDELTAFLQTGGNLLLTGQNIGDDLGTGDPFMNDYLKADHHLDNVNQFLLDGEAGHPISSNTTLFLIGSPGAGISSGVYYCRLSYQGGACVQPLILLK